MPERLEIKKDLMKLDQLIEFLSHHPTKATIYKKTSKKEIPFYKIGKTLLFSKSEILNWLKNERFFRETV